MNVGTTPETMYEFGPFRLDGARRTLLRNGAGGPLLPKSFDGLVALIRGAGHLLTKDALLASAWPDTAVEENSLAKAISDIRKALGEGPRDQRYIATVAGRGYRFAAAVTTVDGRERPQTTAVLPFTNLGADSGTEHLSIGLADALITRLSRLRGLAVRPTGSILRYATGAKDLQKAAHELNAAYVIDGSVRRAGDRIRVTVQLVSAASGAALWADTFDERFSDIFAVEDSISSQVADALALRLSGEERQWLVKPPTGDAQADQLYLNRPLFLGQRTSDRCPKAIA